MDKHNSFKDFQTIAEHILLAVEDMQFNYMDARTKGEFPTWLPDEIKEELWHKTEEVFKDMAFIDGMIKDYKKGKED